MSGIRERYGVHIFCAGAVELEKLVLKKDALHKLRLPIEVRAGQEVIKLVCVFVI